MMYMKKLLLIFTLLLSIHVFAQVVPSKPPASAGLVHDFAGILLPEQERALNEKLIAYNDSTSNQIAIVTLPTLIDSKTGAEYEDEEVALQILREWGIGQKDRNNGIVILVVKSADNKERKIRIEVGYGLEGAVPDITAKSIIDHRMAPYFRQGKDDSYYTGLNFAIDDLIKAAAGEYKAPKGYGKGKGGGKGIGGGIVFFVILFIIIAIISGRRGGGGGGGMMSRRGYSDVGAGWILGTLLSGGGGGWSGGGSSGGGWSGGGGGGFGGFGGGSGGGGGASGSW
jgi:uncharacterized protein